MKCKNCNAPKAEFEHKDGGFVCEKCVGEYFTCPDCGKVFNKDDFVNGDQETGFCTECSPNH